MEIFMDMVLAVTYAFSAELGLGDEGTGEITQMDGAIGMTFEFLHNDRSGSILFFSGSTESQDSIRIVSSAFYLGSLSLGVPSGIHYSFQGALARHERYADVGQDLAKAVQRIGARLI